MLLIAKTMAPAVQCSRSPIYEFHGKCRPNYNVRDLLMHPWVCQQVLGGDVWIREVGDVWIREVGDVWIREAGAVFGCSRKSLKF